MLFAIGEMLIDFVASEKGRDLKEVASFEKVAGGAPANVATLVAKLGAPSSVITQLGEDAFGDYLLDILKENGVGTDYVSRTREANTGLAFVSVKSDGERDFSFYRNPSADLLLEADTIQREWFKGGDYLHFCSVDLVESPMKEAHRRAIAYVKEAGGIISFDPNVRLSLWESPVACRQAILEFLPHANLLKVSDEELAFITGIEDEKKALESLFVGDVKAVLFTKGAGGAQLLTRNWELLRPGFSVSVADTTGAGDAFIGGFLYQLVANGVTDLESYLREHGNELLRFANACGALTTTKRGAIGALPTLTEVKLFLKEVSA